MNSVTMKRNDVTRRITIKSQYVCSDNSVFENQEDAEKYEEILLKNDRLEGFLVSCNLSEKMAEALAMEIFSKRDELISILGREAGSHVKMNPDTDVSRPKKIKVPSISAEKTLPQYNGDVLEGEQAGVAICAAQILQAIRRCKGKVTKDKIHAEVENRNFERAWGTLVRKGNINIAKNGKIEKVEVQVR